MRLHITGIRNTILHTFGKLDKDNVRPAARVGPI